MIDIKITGEYVALDQLFKITDFTQNGGETKFAVKPPKINVNREQGNRRGRKLHAGNVIGVEGSVFPLS